MQREDGPPAGAATTTIHHRVAFYETDAMGVVHHANYAHFMERARVRFLDEHHRPYTEYMKSGLHFAVTRVETELHKPTRFDDVLAVSVWLEWVRGASLRLAYALHSAGGLVATGATEHAVVNESGRPRRLPRERIAELRGLAGR